MAKILYDTRAPAGFGVDENGQFVQVPPNYIQSGSEYVQGPAGSAAPAPSPEKPNEQFVTDLYQKYFDRAPSSAEMSNWANSTPQQLDTFLQGEQEKYGYTSKEQQAAGQGNLNQALQMVDQDPSIPDSMKQYAKDIVQAYDGTGAVNYSDIMGTFDKLKSQTIDPYYNAQMNLLQKGFQTSYNALQGNRQNELETQNANASDAIRNEQGTLEQRGMTNSGEDVRQLGAGSAYAGMNNEGLVPQNNRILASSSALRYNQNLQQLGQQREAALGSGNTGMMPGYNPAGNITGTNEENRQQAQGQALSQLAANQTAKTALNQPVALNLGI